MVSNTLLGVILCLPLTLVLVTQTQSCNDKNMKANSNNANQTQNSNAPASLESPQPAASPSPTPASTRMKGHWGGQSVAMEVTDSGATLEFACAHATITEALVPDANGKFAVKGRFIKERPGPMREGDDNTGQPATYTGAVDGQTLTLSITLTDTDESVGTFALTVGKPSRIRKCL